MCAVMQTRIAVVGQGTGDVLRAKQHSALNIEYTPAVVSHAVLLKHNLHFDLHSRLLIAAER